MGRLDEAENAYKKALEIDPSYNEAFSNMLFSMLNNTKYSVEELSKEHQKYSKYFEKNKINGRIIFTNERSKNKVLNVGFVSGDFRDHPVSDYFTPVLASIAENSSIRTFGYYNYNVSDGRTAELKKYFLSGDQYRE